MNAICIDFDGVIHSYTSGWQGMTAIPDEPTEGAFLFLLRCLDEFDQVFIQSTRARTWRGRRAIYRWLGEHAGNTYYPCPAGRGIEEVKVVSKKPPAVVYLDDRGVRFEGTFPHPGELKRLRTWNEPSP